jgi:hypothetical protein
MRPMFGRSRYRARRGAIRASLVLSLLVGARPAAGEPSPEDAALATVLFRQGRTLMNEGRVPEACLKLAESHRLDPGGGTILNLALCHEREGKLAQSWSEFNEALAFARRDRRVDREAEAIEHANLLEPRLSRLTILVPEEAALEGLRVERDDRELGRASWSLAMPVDGGEHVVRATAPGHEPFTATIAVPGESGAVSVAIPRLSPAPAPHPTPPPQATAPVEPASSLATAPQLPPDGSVRRRAAWIAGGAGLAQLAVASYFGLRAMDLNAQGNPNDDAGTAADRSTVLFVTGVVSAAVGVYLWLTSPPAGRF